MKQTVARHFALALAALAMLMSASACNSSAAPASPDIWAVVDGREIRREDVDKAYRRMIDPTPTPPPDLELLTVKLGILDELISQEVLLSRARALNLEVPEAELTEAFNKRKENVTDEAFQLQLTSRGLTADDLREALRRELLVEKVIEQEIGSKTAVSDTEIADYYAKNRAQFNIPETQYRIAQIIITPLKDPQIRNRTNDDATTPEAAQRKAQMLMERIRGGADFAELAMDYSEDPRTAAGGGDLGFVSATALNQVPAQLRNAVLTAQPGGVNLVSAGGAHTLVKLVSREAPGQRELNAPEVREGITNALKQRKDQLYRAALLAAAKNDVDVRNYLAAQLTRTDSTPSSLAPASGS
jgi:peptidyl-prolyl cis-trans isomerase SurA